jgi:hypothetical protein
MDIADKGQKVVVFFAENGFVSVFEEMPRPIMAAIVVLGVPREEFSHDRRYALFATLKEYMDVIAHEDPGIDPAFALSDILTQALQEFRLILFVFEDDGLIDTPHHDMMQGAGDVQAGLSWHGQSYRNVSCLSRELHI